MAPGGAATLAVSAAVGAPAAWAGLRWATSWLAALVAASTSCPSCVCHAPQWPPPAPSAPPPPPAPSAGAVAAAVAQKLGPWLAANSSPAPATCPSADEVAAALLERLPPLGSEGARAARSAPEAGPAVGEGCPFAFILAWGVACGEAVILVCCCVAARARRRVGLWYPRDTVWHERVLLYLAGCMYWWVLTPGGDRCAEDVSGAVGDGCNRAFTVARDGTAPALAHGASYRSEQPLTWEELRAAVLRSRTDQQVYVGDEPLVDPEEIHLRLGTEVALEPGGVRLDDDHAMVREVGVWQLAEAIPVDAADRGRQLSQTDRSYIEMKCLLTSILCAGSYYQVNLPSMASIEVLCLRVSQIVEAYSGAPLKPPMWDGLRHYMGVAGPMGMMDPAWRTAFLRRNKEEMEQESWKSRAAGPPVVLEVGEGLPSGPSGGADGLSDHEGDWPQLQGRGAARLARRACQDFDEVVDALNWLMNRTSTGDRPNYDQMKVHARILECVAERMPPMETAIPSPRAAFSELLHGRSVYDESAGRNVGRLRNVGQISLPKTAVGGPRLLDIAPAHARHFLEGGFSRMLLDEASLRRRLDECDVIPHWGPSLARNRRLYVRLVKPLYAKGLLVLLDESERREDVGIFFAPKKSDQLRLIIDARRSNLHFTSPPGASLVPAEGFARVEVGGVECGGQPDLGFTLGTSDISDAFHRFRIDRGLSSYFCLRPVTAQEIGVTGRAIGDSAAPPDRRLVPACAALPMGFTWSLYFCQEVGEAVMDATPGLERAHRMSDGGPTTALRPSAQLAEGGGAQYTYVDNLGAMGFDGAEVSSSLAAATTRFDAAGLRTHETDIQRGRGVTLGCVLDGVSLTTRLTAKRYWRVRQGVSWALSCRALPGWTWEVVLGHCAYCAMCNRDLLPVLNAIYKFIAAHYQEAAPLWPTALAEMVAFRGLMPLLRGDWAPPWCPLVCLSDASEHGCAVSASLFELAAVKEIGRVQERSRFRRLGGHSARAHFFASNGIVMTSAGTFKDAADLGEHDEVAPQTQWGLDRTFKEMAAEIFSGSRWTEIVARGWLNTSEDILVYESRALLRAVEILRSLSPREGEHAVVMSDNLPAVLCFERRRAKNFTVLACIRRAVALCLSLNKRLHVRWVPSELNPSDEGSRLCDPSYDPGKTAVHSWEASEDYGKVRVNRRLPQHVHEQDNARTKTTHYCKHADTENCLHDKFGKDESTSKHAVMGLTSTSATTSTSPRTSPQAFDELTETPSTLDPQDLHEPQRSQPAAVATSAPESAPAGEPRRPAAAVGGSAPAHAAPEPLAKRSQVLSPGPEGLPSGPQAPASQTRALGAPRDGVRQRLTLAPPASRAAARDLEANCSPTGDGGGSDATTVANESEAARTRQGAAQSSLAGLTLLERSAARLGTDAKSFIDAAKERQLVVDSEGDVLLSALLHFQPEYGKLGRSRFLWAWRCLKGWRRRCGRRSRKPVARMVWSAVVWDLCCRGCWLMGAHILWMIVTHHRPGEPLAIQRQDLIQPAKGSSNDWGALLFPLSRAATHKMLDLQNRRGDHMELKKRGGRERRSSLKRYQNAARLNLSAPRLLPWEVAAPRKADK
ncbi:unnamed protein product [Prorocentrum cordatum]|uniref:RNA-directed RNA polymerase n=1 Tax=Prorocentrum cordatum TaxID=2364126 RepID=A0ABN9Q326_9DINO|nr:unnamed protein product [Polarella glacialis]